jgi:hypothetical protein
MLDQREDIKQLLKKELDIPSDSIFTFEPRIEGTSIGPDIRIEHKERIWFIEVRRKADWDSIAHLLLYRELVKRDAILVIASRVVPSTIREQGSRIKIVFVQLPGSYVPKRDGTRVHGKVTSERAWKVIYGLISSNNRSIRNISSTEKVSYGWTYHVMNDLIIKGVIERDGNKVALKDHASLFNAVAWERPLKKLEMAEVRTDFDSTTELARTLSGSEYGKELIFCGYLAASFNFGIGIRSDLVQCYLLDHDLLERIRSDYSVSTKGGITLYLYKPDRDVKSSAIRTSDLWVTSMEQTILDLAGLGYQSRDLLDSVVRTYGTDR